MAPMASIASGGGPPESAPTHDPEQPDDARTIEEIVERARRPPRVTPPALRRVPYPVRRARGDGRLDLGADPEDVGGVELDVVGLALLADRAVDAVDAVDVPPPPPPADPLRPWLRRRSVTEIAEPPAPGGAPGEET
jgi:hypothetical protein